MADVGTELSSFLLVTKAFNDFAAFTIGKAWSLPVLVLQIHARRKNITNVSALQRPSNCLQ
jgi:hypothetical protein